MFDLASRIGNRAMGDVAAGGRQAATPAVQRLSIGSGTIPAGSGWQVVPAAHRQRLRSAMSTLTGLRGNRRLAAYFRDHAPGGTITTWQEVFDRAQIWYQPTPGALGEAYVGGNDMAYDPTIYRIGKWQLVATLLHEAGHLSGINDERTAEGAAEAGRAYAPIIMGMSTRSGPVGSVVRIRGLSFGLGQGSRDRVLFNGVEAPDVVSWRWAHNTQGEIKVRVPAGAATGPVVVENNGVASPGRRFVVT